MGPDQWTLLDKDAACIPKNGCIQVCITDFGGLLVYQQTHPMLFAGRALYVAVYSCASEVSWLDLQAHIMNVTSRTRESPILLVGTHHDKRSSCDSIPLPALKKKFPQVGVMPGADAN
jgi:GTPase SAR1 family protein